MSRLAGGFARYLDDPWADPGFARAAVSEETEALIVGGGFGGLLCGARLRAGRHLRFPHRGKGRAISAARGTGIAIPVPPAIPRATSICRCWKRPATCRCANTRARRRSTSTRRRIGRHFGLYERALFQTVISRMAWQEGEGRWLVETDRGDRIRARFVILAGGPLSRPKLPGIPGIETFKGHSFHTSRWDYAYTGGDSRRRSRPASPTSASASSALVPPPCNACRISAARRKNSTSSSARRRRSACATIVRRISLGRRA